MKRVDGHRTSAWRLLHSRQLAGAKFRRQHPFGPYVIAFYCVASELAIEVDGSQHVVPDGLKRDAIRTRYLRQRGVRVLRFSDRGVLLDGEAVLAVVEQALDFGVDSGAPSP